MKLTEFLHTKFIKEK